VSLRKFNDPLGHIQMEESTPTPASRLAFC
jgi:hypothetical protein